MYLLKVSFKIPLLVLSVSLLSKDIVGSFGTKNIVKISTSFVKLRLLKSHINFSGTSPFIFLSDLLL